MRWGALETELTIPRKDKFGVEFEELQFKQESVKYFECNCGQTLETQKDFYQRNEEFR